NRSLQQPKRSVGQGCASFPQRPAACFTSLADQVRHGPGPPRGAAALSRLTEASRKTACSAGLTSPVYQTFSAWKS
ncbi:MAG: hypothetical protein AAFQ76_15000, partial [Cyanobacteria bacterium J06626_26]